MGTGTKIFYVLFRCAEFFSACVVAGIVGYFLNRVHLGGGPQNGRIVYTEVTAGLGIVVSLFLVPPLSYAFNCFAIDGVMSIMWLVAFSLMADLGGGSACDSVWFRTYWGWYWNRWWRRPNVVLVDYSCSEWRAILGFSFIGFICFLVSGGIGFAMWRSHRDERSNVVNGAPESSRNKRRYPWVKEKHPQTQTQAIATEA